ncbi:MAG: ketoacyl-ACP synthase III [Acidobacteria bacterium]|nr:ketoacyl-ACP synthase III [Acidobacteriota bacterium]
MSRNAKITAVGKYLPEKRLNNIDLENLVETSDSWIVERTGILERRIVSNGQTNSDMAAAAARRILEERQMGADEIDLIIVATVTPDMFFPSTACVLQEKIGATRAWGFDLLGACSGFLYALASGAQFISTGTYQKVLIVGSDVMSSIINFRDRATCVLFGDGAGAVLLEPTEKDEEGIFDFLLKSDGRGGKFLYMPAGGSLNPASHETIDRNMHYVHQDGRQVFKLAIKGMVEVSREILERHGYTGADLALYVPHQANLRIIQASVEKLNLRPDQVMVNIQKYANTTAGTIPICLAEAREENRLKKGDLVLLTSFGAGLTWGSILLRWEL